MQEEIVVLFAEIDALDLSRELGEHLAASFAAKAPGRPYKPQSIKPAPRVRPVSDSLNPPTLRNGSRIPSGGSSRLGNTP